MALDKVPVSLPISPLFSNGEEQEEGRLPFVMDYGDPEAATRKNREVVFFQEYENLGDPATRERLHKIVFPEPKAESESVEKRSWKEDLQIWFIQQKVEFSEYLDNRPMLNKAIKAVMSDTGVRILTLVAGAIGIGIVAAIGGAVPIAAASVGLIAAATVYGVVRGVMKTHEIRKLRKLKQAELKKEEEFTGKTKSKGKESHEKKVGKLKDGLEEEISLEADYKEKLVEGVVTDEKSTARSLLWTYVDYGLESAIVLPLKIFTGSILGIGATLISLGAVALGLPNQQKYEERRDEIKDDIAQIRLQRAEMKQVLNHLVGKIGKDETIDKLVEIKKESRVERILGKHYNLDKYIDKYGIAEPLAGDLRTFVGSYKKDVEIPSELKQAVERHVKSMDEAIRREATALVEAAQASQSANPSMDPELEKAQARETSIGTSVKKYVKGDLEGHGLVESSLREDKEVVSSSHVGRVASSRDNSRSSGGRP